jgi:LEA14-like dessication related protein
MFKLATIYRRRKTQTASSAFFCMPQKLRICLIAAIAVVFIIRIPTTPAQPSGEEKPQIHLKGLSFKSIDWANRIAQTELSIVVDNPGPAFKLRDLSYRLKLNDKQAAEGKYDKEIELPARASKTVALPCSIDLTAIPGVAWAVISGGFDVHYQFDTEFTVPLFPPLSPRIKTSINGELSLTESVSGWSARIKERISGN